MSETSSTTRRVISFYDWYDVWAGGATFREGVAHAPTAPVGVRLAIQTSTPSEAFFRRDMPWERGSLNHQMLIHEGGRYRMWYRCSPVLDQSVSFMCYAESRDGFQWTRPFLNMVEFDGSTNNNILFSADWFGLQSVFIDPNGLPQERYKSIAPTTELFRDGKRVPYEKKTKRDIRELRRAMELEGFKIEDIHKAAHTGRHLLEGAVSPDGIHWRILDRPLRIMDVPPDTQNIATYDPQSRRYVAYLRGHMGRRRTVTRMEGERFADLPAPAQTLLTDPANPPDEDIYTNAYCREPRDVGVPRHLMFPAIYHRAQSTVDVQLATSRDGVVWTRVERKAIIGRTSDAPDQPYGTIYAAPNLVTLGSEHWALPYRVNKHRHNEFSEKTFSTPEPDGEYRWAVWPRERLAGLVADKEGAVGIVSEPCHASEVRINFRSEPDGWIKLALIRSPSRSGDAYAEFANFTMACCDPLVGDHLEARATWRGNSNISSLKGEEIGLWIQMCKATLFSITI